MFYAISASEDPVGFSNVLIFPSSFAVFFLKCGVWQFIAQLCHSLLDLNQASPRRYFLSVENGSAFNFMMDPGSSVLTENHLPACPLAN